MAAGARRSYHRLEPDERIALTEYLRSNSGPKVLANAARTFKISVSTAMIYRTALRRRNECRCGLPAGHPGECKKGADPRPPFELREQALRLRETTDLTAVQIAEQLGMSENVAYRYLKGTHAPRSGAWSAEEDEAIRQLWPTGGRNEIEAAIPDRPWGAIGDRASVLGVRRRSEANHPLPKGLIHPIAIALRQRRYELNLTIPQVVSRMAGIEGMVRRGEKLNKDVLVAVERGNRRISMHQCAIWAAALGMEIVLVPVEKRLWPVIDPPPPPRFATTPPRRNDDGAYSMFADVKPPKREPPKRGKVVEIPSVQVSWASPLTDG